MSIESIMIYVFLLFFLVGIGLSLYVFFGPKLPGMQEGLWEITTQIRWPGDQEPSFLKTSQHLTREDCAPEITIPGYTCSILRHKDEIHVLGNHVLWQVHCEGPKVVQGTGHIKYKGNIVKGKIKLAFLGGSDVQKRCNAIISGIRIKE